MSTMCILVPVSEGRARQSGQAFSVKASLVSYLFTRSSFNGILFNDQSILELWMYIFCDQTVENFGKKEIFDIALGHRASIFTIMSSSSNDPQAGLFLA